MIPKLCVTPVRAGDKPDTDYVTVEEACEILGLKDSQTRKLLGEPDKVWLSASNQVQYAFETARVHKIKQERDERLQRHIAEYGMKSCYLCRKKFLKSELVSGICPACQARKIVRNFVARGDYFSNKPEISRLKLLADAILEFGKENQE